MLEQIAARADVIDLRGPWGAVVDWMGETETQPLVGRRTRLEALVLGSSDAIVFVEADGLISEWNPAAERMFGWSRDEAIGAPFVFVTPPGLDIDIQRELAGSRRGSATIKSPLLRKDDSVFQAELTVTAIVDEDGNRGLVADVRDITDRVLVEEAVAAISSDLDPARALASFAEVLRVQVPFQQFSVAVPEGSHYRRLVSVGSASQFAWGEEVPLAGNSVAVAVAERRVVVCRDTALGSFEFDRRLSRTGIASYVILPLLSDGKVFATLNIGFRDPAVPDDSVVRLLESIALAVAQGVQNILLFERQREAADRLREVDEMKSDFVAMVAHDLRSPVAAVTGFASMLVEMWDSLGDAEKLRLASTLKRGAQNIASFIDDVLRVALLESGEIPYTVAPFEFGDLVRGTVAELVPSDAPERINVDLDPELPPAMADERRQWQILWNLLSNAVKFSPLGAPIDIRAVPQGDEILVTVQDRGLGIAPDQMKLLFKKFSRIPDPRTRQTKGTGLGLFLAKKMIEEQGGRIWLESAPGEGSAFSYTIPTAGDE